MIEWIQVAGHVITTILDVAYLALRIEHRITKIETDVSWLKERYVNDKND